MSIARPAPRSPLGSQPPLGADLNPINIPSRGDLQAHRGRVLRRELLVLLAALVLALTGVGAGMGVGLWLGSGLGRQDAPDRTALARSVRLLRPKARVKIKTIKPRHPRSKAVRQASR